jgi:hypothetical protein
MLASFAGAHDLAALGRGRPRHIRAKRGSVNSAQWAQTFNGTLERADEQRRRRPPAAVAGESALEVALEVAPL